MALDDRFAQEHWEKRDTESPGIHSEIITGPVSDWATDFSHMDPGWAADPYFDSGRPAAALPDSAHEPVRRTLAADALPGHRRNRPRRRPFLFAVDHHG